MKTVLIVEDEKMIRQGIRSMIQRSGVPVEVIIECSNGEMALEVLHEQEVDVMFTDIRMPKMDGIELVKRMQECSHIPLTVVISGYDDFSYAVEMMREGVREYLLKPVEREKITEILQKLDEEIRQQAKKVITKKRLGYQQIKQIMLLSEMTEEEWKVLEEQYADDFFQENYVVCVQNIRKRENLPEEKYIFLSEIEERDVFVAEKQALPLLLKNELEGAGAGISGLHLGLRELRCAYKEAAVMHKKAFCRGMEFVQFGEAEEKIPETLIEEAAKLTSEAGRMKRVQLLGTDKTEELSLVWEQFFAEVMRGRIAPEDYEACMQDFFRELGQTYRNALQEEEEALEKFQCLFGMDGIMEYQEQFMEWILKLHENITAQLEVNHSSQKMRMAVEYIKENYAKDLNMAVVSNYISMNYSLFSYSFKQFTGSNFVNYLKDIRMKEAKRLLAETDYKIIEISQMVGYDNEKHFMKIFKASCGVSPSEYRKNMKCE